MEWNRAIILSLFFIILVTVAGCIAPSVATVTGTAEAAVQVQKDPVNPTTPFLTTAEPEPAPPPGTIIAGYITHWHINRLENIDLSMLTHLIWQGIEVTSSNDAALRVLGDKEWEQIERAVAVGHAAGIEVLVSLVGFWNSASLSSVWSSPVLREELITNLIGLVLKYDLDGLDIDNENGCEPELFDVFITELYESLPQGKTLTLAAHPARLCISAETAEYLNFINLMTYDMGSSGGYPYHSTFRDSMNALKLWAGSGIPRNKLLLGIPFYGRDANTSHFEYWWIAQTFQPAPEQNRAL